MFDTIFADFCRRARAHRIHGSRETFIEATGETNTDVALLAWVYTDLVP